MGRRVYVRWHRVFPVRMSGIKFVLLIPFSLFCCSLSLYPFTTVTVNDPIILLLSSTVALFCVLLFILLSVTCNTQYKLEYILQVHLFSLSVSLFSIQGKQTSSLLTKCPGNTGRVRKDGASQNDHRQIVLLIPTKREWKKKDLNDITTLNSHVVTSRRISSSWILFLLL